MENSIKVGYDSQTGMYTFKAGYTPSLSVNGKSIIDPLTGGFKNSELYVISEKPEVITYTVRNKSLKHYENIETGEIVPMDLYKSLEDEIKASREYDDDSDEYVYETVEAEVAALRFARTYKLVWEDIEEIRTMDFEIIEYPVSAYKNIVPLYSLDAKNIFETKCKFTPTNIETFYEICAEYGIDKSRIDMPSHSGLRYAKIDNTYLTGAEDFEKFGSNQTIATYEECIERMDNNRKRLNDMISMHLAKTSQKILDKGMVGDLLKELLTLKSRVSGLDVKQKDYNSQRSLVVKMNELIETYKQLA